MDICGLVNLPGWCLTLFLFFLSLYLYSKYKLSFWSKLGVPHPKPTIFIGHVHMMKNGLGEFDLKMHSAYDKIVGTYFFHRPSLLILDPELARDILIKRFSSIPNTAVPFKRQNDLQYGLIKLKGNHWRFMRSLISPIFSSGKLRSMSPMLQQCCSRLIKNIEDKTKLGHSIDIKRMFGDFTMDAMAAVGFGIELNLYNTKENEFANNAKGIFSAFLGFGLLINAFMPPLYSLLCKLELDIDRQNKYCLYFKHLVEQAKKLRKDDKKRNDLLQCLLDAHKDTDVFDTEHLLEHKVNKEQWKKNGLTTAEVNGNSMMFILAGYETTSTVLTFTAYSLATNPEHQDRLISEIDGTIGQDTPDYDNIQKLEYLDCVIKEALRLYPPTLRSMRETHQEMEISGYTIPENTDVSVSIYALHRSPKYWENPEKYDPERFLAKNKSNLTPYAFLPFGLGPRNCVALRLAYLETKCALVTILQKYMFVKCEETEIPVKLDPGPLLKPKNGIFLKMEKRKSKIP